MVGLLGGWISKLLFPLDGKVNLFFDKRTGSTRLE